MLSLLLNQHPEVHCPQEPWLLLGLAALGQVPPEHPADAPLLAGLVAEFLGSERNAILKTAAETIYREVRLQSGKSLLVDKTPRYYLCLDLLERFLPERKGILLLRNPLDVAASYLTSWNVNLATVIRERRDSPFFFDYVLGFRRLHALRQRQPVLTVHYETLVRNAKQEMATIFAHLGIACDEVSTKVDPRTSGYSESYFADKKILNSPTVHANSVNSYQQAFSAEEVGILLGALGEQLFVDLGYGEVWQEARAHFSLPAVADESADLTSLAEAYLAQRLAGCRAAANDFTRNQPLLELSGRLQQASAECTALTAERTALTAECAALTAERAALTAQCQALAVQNADLAQQVHAFVHMGVRQRLRGLLLQVRRSLRQRMPALLWRLNHGRPLPALPRITVVTPVFNGEAHIAETMTSVLSQDYPDLEYIIVDGASTDRTLEIIASFQERSDFPQRITRVVSEPDQGMYDAIGKGFALASGEILCYLNADDLFEANGLRAVGEFFARQPKVQAIYHEDVVLTQGWKFPNARQPANVGTADLLAGHILFQDGVFWRRAVYEQIGGIRRDLRLAGDFDLWLRLSACCRFVRRPGHVSCFRIREGQLSGQMQHYHEEMQQSVRDFMATQPLHRRLRWRLQQPWRAFWRRLQRRLGRDRLFFPVNFAQTPPEVLVPPGIETFPLSPIDGRPAERLLFSTPDTRFGEREINYIYLDTRHNITITHPPIEAGKLDALYRKHYSNPPTEIVWPQGYSPYRLFNGRRVWEKVLRRLPLEWATYLLNRLFPNPWGDNTLDELMQVLRAAGIDPDQPLRFLDTGCFEGHLLDRIREHTPWQAAGLEPNDRAVETARGKGHEVWQGHAEHAVETVPENRSFDVVFMGQSIEHVDDPLSVLRRLRLLLAPGGVLVMSTPNLDSREIDHFGPTWAHWHVPYHRYIFSRKGLQALVRQAGLAPVHFQTFSHPYWTAMTIAQNQLGLGGSASHAVSFERAIALRAQRDQFWKLVLWNRLGKGDYCFLVAKDGPGD